MKQSAKSGAAVFVMAGALLVAAVGLSACMSGHGPNSSATDSANQLANATARQARAREERAAAQRADRERRRRLRRQATNLLVDYWVASCFAPAQQKAEAVTQTETVFAPTHRAEFGTNGGGGGC